MSNIAHLKNIKWTEEEIEELVEVLADLARDMPESVQIAVASIVAGKRDPLVKSCYELLMASSWTAKYASESDRWAHAERMAIDAKKTSDKLASLCKQKTNPSKPRFKFLSFESIFFISVWAIILIALWCSE
jgi:hypothetical protein